MKDEISYLQLLGTGDKKEYFPEFLGCTIEGNTIDDPAKFMLLQESLDTDFEKSSTCSKFVNMYTPVERIEKY